MAATILNVKAFNALKDQQELEGLRSQQLALIPVLDRVGLFDLFQPMDWLRDNEGRTWIGVLYFHVFPEKMDEQVQKRLIDVSQTASPLLREEMHKLLGI